MLAGRPRGSTTRRWVMRKHQGYASLAACNTTYAGNATLTSGSGINPPCATQRTRSKKEDSCHAPAVSHSQGELGGKGAASTPLAQHNGHAARKKIPATKSRVTQGGLGGKFFAGSLSHACCSDARCRASAQQFMLKTWTSACQHTTVHC